MNDETRATEHGTRNKGGTAYFREKKFALEAQGQKF